MRWLSFLMVFALLAGCVVVNRPRTATTAARNAIARAHANANLMPPPLPDNNLVSRGMSRQVTTDLTPSNSPSGPGVTLEWDAVQNVAGYNVYYGPAPRTYTNVVTAGNSTTATVPAAVLLPRWYAVTAYDSLGLESDFSNEVECSTLQNHVIEWVQPPANPTVQMSTNLRTWQAISPPFTFTVPNAVYRLKGQ